MVCLEALAVLATLSTLNFRQPLSASSSRVACKILARASARLRTEAFDVCVDTVIDWKFGNKRSHNQHAIVFRLCKGADNIWQAKNAVMHSGEAVALFLPRLFI